MSTQSVCIHTIFHSYTTLPQILIKDKLIDLIDITLEPFLYDL